MNIFDLAVHFAIEFATLAVTLYGLLLIIGAPAGKSPKLANDYAAWLGSKMSLVAIFFLCLPFKAVAAGLEKIFVKKKSKGKKKKKKNP